MNTTLMKTTFSTQPKSESPARARSIFQTIGAVAAALATWILVATILNLPMRIAWPHYHAAEAVFNFTLAMKLARLALGALSSLAAGFVAAWIGKGRTRPAMLTGVILLGLFIPDHYLLWSKFPVWYHLTFLVSIVPLTLLGAAGYRRLNRKRGT